MRAWHLVGLRQADGERVRFHPPEGGVPLMLPASIPSGDQEQIIAFFQQVAGEEPLGRVEIDWYRSILDRQRDFLERTYAERGSSGVLLVIKVRAEGVNADDVLTSRLVTQFEHVVVASAHPLAHERLANLAALTKVVEIAVREGYDSLAEGMRLDASAWRAIRPVVSLLLSPVDVVEAANALVEIQLEPAAPLDLESALRRRTLARLLGSRSADELVSLAAHATAKVDEASTLLGPDRWRAASGGIERDLLIRNTRLRGWAAWVGLDEGRGVLREALATAGRPVHEAARAATEWIGAAERTLTGKGPLWRRILDVMRLIGDGKLARAREELDALEGEVGLPGTTRGDRGAYWAAVGRYRRAMGELGEAETAYRRALDLLERAEVALPNRGAIQSDLATVLRDSSRWTEAEVAFREALRLQEEGGDTPTSRGITLGELARGLRDNGRWTEAEVAFREALRLKEEGGDIPTSRGITLHELARGLRDNGRWTEAEVAFREALRLQEEGGDTPTSRSITLHELARGLRDNGRWTEAEVAFREALRLKEEGGDTPTSRGITLDELARGLRDNGRWKEAEVAFREALRLKEEGGDTAESRAITWQALARGLRSNGRHEEADAALREARQLRQK